MNPETILDSMYQGRTLVFGHRGAKTYAPMNTIPAFELAVRQGADGVELDVHLSKDGHPIVLHDFSVDATTDGTGLARDMMLAQLKELDAGGWFGESFRGIRIPTLDEVFDAVGHSLYINVEIKSESTRDDSVERVVADTIARHSMQRRVIISSFNPEVLQRFRAVMPEAPLGFLYEREESTYEDLMANLPHEALHPHQSLIDAAYMTRSKQSGYRVNAWTVNDPARALELRDLGVNGIITDAPDTILKALRG